MLRFLVTRPIAVLMSFLGAMVLGVIVLRQLPVSLLPEVPIPQISVEVAAPERTAREIEQTVTAPLRNQLLQVNALQDIHSQSRNGSAWIRLDFDYGTNTDLTFIEVNEKIDQAMAFLPRNLERPRVVKANAADVPILYLAVAPREQSGTTMLDLSEFTRSVLKRRLEQLSTVAFVDLTGTRIPMVAILPNTVKLRSLGWNEEDLERIIRSNDLDLGNLLIQDGQYQYQVRFTSALHTLDDLRSLQVRAGDRILRLDELADIEAIAQPERGLARWNDRDCLLVNVRKKADAQLFQLKAEIDTVLAQFEHEYPDLDILAYHNQSQILQISIQNLRTSLLYGACFAILIIFAFFREWRSPVLIGITIPVSLVVSLFGFYLLNMSINVISLSGLILGVGLMIDNSIIVMDNIRQWRREGLDLTDASVTGANEVIRPLISSALTTCSVFLPLMFLSGLGGALFTDQALSITIALGSSLLVGYILLPTLLRLISRKRGYPVMPERSGRDGFALSVDAVLSYRWVFLLLFLGFIASAWWLESQLDRAAFPALSRDAVELHIDWNEPLNPEENARRLEDLREAWSDRIDNSFLQIGEQQWVLEESQQETNEATWVAYVRHPERLAEVQDDLAGDFTRHYPQASVEVRPLQNLFDRLFGRRNEGVEADIYGLARKEVPSYPEIEPKLKALRAEGFRVSEPPMQEQIELSIDQEKLALYQVDPEGLIRKLKTLFNENQIGTLRTSQQFVPIRIRLPQEELYQTLSGAMIANRQGTLLPLNAFITTARSWDYKQIFAGKSGEVLPVALDIGDEASLARAEQIIAAGGKLAVRFSGALFDNASLIRQLVWITLISLLLLYLILAAQFESILQPFIVMISVPVGISGALLALWLAGESLNLVSLIGIIVMSGIVVNDAILKVDMINRARKDHDMIEAIHIAGRRRLRPILMTSITTILALLPVLIAAGLGAELQRPLAIAVMGGLTAGTVAGLYWIPLLYFLLVKGR